MNTYLHQSMNQPRQPGLSGVAWLRLRPLAVEAGFELDVCFLRKGADAHGHENGMT